MSAYSFLRFFLRVTGIMWGGVHPDENFSFSVRVLAGEISPGMHFYPPLLNYLNAIGYALMFIVGRILGIWNSTDAFRMQWFENPAPFYFTGRLITALFGSLSSVIAFRIAREMKYRFMVAFIIGLVFAAFPINVLLSHISKSDIALGTATLLFLWVYIFYQPRLQSIAYPFLLGVSSSLMLSFKHSIIFFLAPFFVIFLLQRIFIEKIKLSKQLYFGGVFCLAFSTSLVIFNIGVFTDLNSFIQYQELQSYIALRPFLLGSFIDSLNILGSSFTGTTWVCLLAWLSLPLITREHRIITIWISSMIGLITLIFLTGNRTQPQILLPLSMIIVLLGMMVLSNMTLKHQKMLKILGSGGIAVTLLSFSMTTFSIVIQSLAPPINERVTDIVKSIAIPNQSRILTSKIALINLPISPKALADEDQRHQDLGQRYHVEISQRAPERIELRKRIPNPNYYIRQIPWAFGGLEVYDDGKIPVVKPYTWPIQKSEWDLNFWLKQGYKIFVIENEEFYLNADVPAYADFHKQVRESGILVAELTTERPLFFEGDVKIYVIK